MKSKNNTLVVKKHTNLGYMPVFISMAQRHLEKGQPEGKAVDIGAVEYPIPVDILKLSVTDDSLLQGISGVILTYRAK